MLRSVTGVILVLGWMCGVPVFAGGHEHTDFEIGQDGSASHVLLIEGDQDMLMGIEPIVLEPLSDPFSTLDGWFVAAEPGWEGLEQDEPAEGLFALLPGHQIGLQRVSFDAGFSMFDGSENPILAGDGASYVFPADAKGGFHDDLIFAAGPGTLLGSELSATFLLTDAEGLHGDSEPFSLSFAVVPEPGTLALVGLGVLGFVGRRRRGIG